jgi:SAM-dependent methyltransferase
MTSAGPGQYRYTQASARLYGSIGIEGTTYQIGFDAVRELLGDITGQAFLDFGCGTGRSTAFLRALGAGHVYGVDHDRNMISAALARQIGGAEFLLAGDTIPLLDASADGAVSLNVFVEIRTHAQMRRVCAEIARILRPGGTFILESSSPMAFGRTFRSYRYPQAEGLSSGSRTPCVVTTAEGAIVIEDTYWTEDDYVRALTQAGLDVTTISYPRPPDPSAWTTDEATIPPCIVIQSLKPAEAVPPRP